MNEKLSNYIKEQQQKGISNEEIKRNLIQAGWQESVINGYFDDVKVPNPVDYILEDEEIKQLDPKAVTLFFLGNSATVALLIAGIPIIIISIVSFIATGSSLLGVIFLIPLFSLLIIYVIARLEYNFYRYKLNANGFYKEHGIIAKKYTTIPYEKIQNIDIHQNIFARILGLYSLKIQTAGNSGIAGAEGTLPGINQEEAERLKSELLRRSRHFGQRNF